MSGVQQREKRLGKELLKMKQKPIEGCSVDTVEDKMEHWKVVVKGPDSTPFEKGLFTFDFKFPNEYPFHPPDVRCTHQVYHPNFDKEGKVCLELLRKDGWSPMVGVGEIIVALQELLRTPNIDHPLTENIAEEYSSDKKAYEKNAREWTSKYAK